MSHLKKGKLVFRTRGSSTYVYFETARTYNSDSKWNVPKRVVIGKLVSGDDQSRMFPNEKFSELFPSIPVTELAPPVKRCSTLKAGTFIVFEKIIRDAGLDVILEEIFGRKSGLILDLLSYMIISEDNAAQYYPDYAAEHPLFTEGMQILSDSTLSDFFREISSAQISAFLSEWNRRRKHRQRIYVSYDSANKNCRAGEIDLAESGKAKTDKGVPVISLSLAFDSTNRVPLFYETYLGSVNDVSQLRYVADRAFDYGYRDIGWIFDRGYFGRENMEYLDEKGFAFLMMVKGCKSPVTELVDSLRNTFEHDRAFHVSGTGLHAVTVERPLYDGGRRRWFHLCFSPVKMLTERRELKDTIENITLELKKAEGREFTVDRPFTDYFDCHCCEEGRKRIFLFAEERKEEILKSLQRCGYFCLISSEKMTDEDAYHLYSGRDASEKLFRDGKSFPGSESMRVHSASSARSKLFTEFLALIVRNRFYSLLKDEMRRLNVRVLAAIRVLEKIELTRRSGSLYGRDHALTRSQKEILRSFGLSEEDESLRLQQLVTQLKDIKDQPAETQLKEEN